MSIIGKAAPQFTAPAAKDGEIVDISLDDYKGKWLVMFFYPLDFTFVCPTELVAFSDRAEDFVQQARSFSEFPWIRFTRTWHGCEHHETKLEWAN